MALEVDSLSVRYVHPRLGRLLFRASVGALCGAIGLAAIGIGLRAPSHLWSVIWTVVVWSFLASPVLAVLSAIASSWSIPPATQPTLEADERGLRITKGRRSKWIPRDKIDAGLVVRSSEGPALELSLKSGRKMVVVVEKEHQAFALLAALGIDASRRRVAVTLGGANRQLIAGCMTFPFGFIALLMAVLTLPLPKWIGAPTFAASFTMLMLLILRASRPMEVIVGTDGLVIRGVWRRRFIPYSALDVAEIELSSTLVLKLRTGERVAISAGDFWSRRALCERILDSMQAHDNLAAEGRAELELLEPRGRALSVWLGTLRSLVKRRGDYRSAGISDEALLSVVADPEAAPGRRVGAALALRMSGNDEAASKIQAAAEACANEGVRVALSRAAEDKLDEATLERALEEEAEEAEARARAQAARREKSDR